jgi:hypothetical protein
MRTYADVCGRMRQVSYVACTEQNAAALAALMESEVVGGRSGWVEIVQSPPVGAVADVC